MPRTPDPIDVHVGARIRTARYAMNAKQDQLGEAIGVSFQMVQRYERGFNRISASAIYRACHFLEVTPGWLFDGMDDAAPIAEGA